MLKKINALKARQNLGTLLEEVFYRGDQFVIERAGKPMAAVVPVWQLAEWRKHRERFFSKIEAVWKKSAGLEPALLEKEVAEAVRAVRKKGSAKKG